MRLGKVGIKAQRLPIRGDRLLVVFREDRQLTEGGGATESVALEVHRQRNTLRMFEKSSVQTREAEVEGSTRHRGSWDSFASVN